MLVSLQVSEINDYYHHVVFFLNLHFLTGQRIYTTVFHASSCRFLVGDLWYTCTSCSRFSLFSILYIFFFFASYVFLECVRNSFFFEYINRIIINPCSVLYIGKDLKIARTKDH